eukprot:10541545-Alexandrium_andersonii.AAC.1
MDRSAARCPHRGLHCRRSGPEAARGGRRGAASGLGAKPGSRCRAGLRPGSSGQGQGRPSGVPRIGLHPAGSHR